MQEQESFTKEERGIPYNLVTYENARIILEKYTPPIEKCFESHNIEV